MSTPIAFTEEQSRSVSTPIAFTEEQSATIAARQGSRLLVASAGSGKTAVLVERFVEYVCSDGLAVSEILALTFTEKAAAEMRERLRSRFKALARDDVAAALDSAWIGTIHGFCLRFLRSEGLAAGLSPGFSVLAPATVMQVTARSFDRAFETWIEQGSKTAIDVGATYGRAVLRRMVLSQFEALRSRGETVPALAIPAAPRPPHTEFAQLMDARESALDSLRDAKQGQRVTAALEALMLCEQLGGEVVLPFDLDPLKLPRGASVLASVECDQYRAALSAYRQACCDYHAWPAIAQISELFSLFVQEYANAKAVAGGVDFEDLQLAARDLLRSSSATLKRWSERFGAIMIDEFQDTNQVQLDLLDALARDNLFAVGDEFQSIYGFRHADVGLFRCRRQTLGDDRIHQLATNFRSGDQLITAFNASFSELWRQESFIPLVCGRADDTPRAVEVLLTDSALWEEHEQRLGLTLAGSTVGRRAEARYLAHHIREQVDAGVHPQDIAVLLRVGEPLALFERAIAEQGLPTHILGGRGFWCCEQVTDVLAYLAALANPLDELALYGVLASPFCGVGSDALILLSQAARMRRQSVWGVLREIAQGDVVSGGAIVIEDLTDPSAIENLTDPSAWLNCLSGSERDRVTHFVDFFTRERDTAVRLSISVIIERALALSGYDLEILRRRDGVRRSANLRKLVRLAREFELANGSDIAAFLAQARLLALRDEGESEAVLEGEGSIQLMTIHRAKGLEFPVVYLADLGRQVNLQREPLIVGSDGAIGLRFNAGDGRTEPAFAYERLTAEQIRHEEEEEKRLFYVAMTRAKQRLILSGTVNSKRTAMRRSPLDWIAPALLGAQAIDIVASEQVEVQRTWQGQNVSISCSVSSVAALADILPAPQHEIAQQLEIERPSELRIRARVLKPVAPNNLSFSALSEYRSCGYGFYLRRIVGLSAESDAASAPSAGDQPRLSGRARGVIAHALLQRLDFARPQSIDADGIMKLARVNGFALTDADIACLGTLVTDFTDSELFHRLRRASELRREAPFLFSLGTVPLTAVKASLPSAPSVPAVRINGVVDLWARESSNGSVLIVDYKTDELADDETPAERIDQSYELQRVVYALAALHAGANEVEVCYCFLAVGSQTVSATYTHADIARLEGELRAVVSAVHSGDYQVSAQPHRGMCSHCPGRSGLCSWSDEMTLRARPDVLRTTSAN